MNAVLEAPRPDEIRKRISKVEDDEMRIFLKALFLFCARASELCGKIDGYDAAHGKHVWGPNGEDCRTEHWHDTTYPRINGDVAVFTIQTAKRGGFLRRVALPIDPKYEPWTGELVEHWKRRKGGRVFNFTRHRPKNYVNEEGVFSGLKYPITKYILIEDSVGEGAQKVNKTKTIESHLNPLVLHGLRHIRAIELMEYYQFSLEHVAIYGGWTLQSMSGQIVSPVLINTYLQLGYRFYIGKLLVEKEGITS